MKVLSVLFLCLGLVAPSVFAMRTGGISAASPSDVEQETIDFVMQAINDDFASNGDTVPRQLDEIIKVRTQVVAGTRYYLVVGVTGGSPMGEWCNVEVVFAPWIQEDTAEDKRLEIVAGPECHQNMPGGMFPVGKVEKEVLDGLNFAVDEFNSQSNNVNLYKLAVEPDALEVYSSTVSGFIFTYNDVLLMETECQKGSNANLAQCDVNPFGLAETCSMEVWFQSWRTPQFTLESITCSA